MKQTPLENWIMEKSGIPERKRELLENYQLERIRETVRYAKNHSRFYREHLKNIPADAITSPADLQRVPFTFPQQVSDRPPDFLCVPQSQIKRIVTLKSSGTSGAEKRIYFSEEDLGLTTDFFAYGMSCLADRTDRVMVLLPGNSCGSIGDLLKKALSEAGIGCLVHGVMTDTEETAASIVKNRITCLVGIPIQVLRLSRAESGAFQRIRKVLLSTDYVPEVLIDELTARYGCRVFTHYGMTEMGYGGGVECEALNGYHMREADLYFEIVDPVTGRPVPDGQWGEAVFTTLNRQAMPLIRYRTGDIAAFSSAPCACGTFLKTMKRVRGRLGNRIRIGEDEYLYLSELDEAVLSFREVLDYKACLSADGRVDIEMVTDNGLVPDSRLIAERIQEYLLKKYGHPVDLSVRVSRKAEPDPIANSMTKRTIGDRGGAAQQSCDEAHE